MTLLLDSFDLFNPLKLRVSEAGRRRTNPDGTGTTWGCWTRWDIKCFIFFKFISILSRTLTCFLFNLILIFNSRTSLLPILRLFVHVESYQNWLGRGKIFVTRFCYLWTKIITKGDENYREYEPVNSTNL